MLKQGANGTKWYFGRLFSKNKEINRPAKVQSWVFLTWNNKCLKLWKYFFSFNKISNIYQVFWKVLVWPVQSISCSFFSLRIARTHSYPCYIGLTKKEIFPRHFSRLRAHKIFTNFRSKCYLREFLSVKYIFNKDKKLGTCQN